MKTFFTYFYKTCLWVLAFFGLVAVLLCLGLFSLISNLDKVVAEVEPPPTQMILEISLEGGVEASPASGFDSLFGGSLRLHEIIATLEYAADDAAVEGVLLTFGTLDIGLADAEELRAALLDFKESGKSVMAWADSFGEFVGGTTPYYLASTADEVWMQPMGMVAFSGLSAQIPFARDLLNSIGITPEVIRRENYKTMLDSLAFSEITPENREMVTAILTDINDQLIGDIAPSRGLSTKEMRDLMDNMPATDEDSVATGLIDRLAWRDEIDEFVGQNGAELYALDLYAENIAPRIEETPADVHFALIYATGNIARADMANMMPIDMIIEGLELAAADEAISAIILRVDSGGGSAIGSERLRRAVALAAAEKPLIVSMGNMAGSGGYWIATDASSIVAQPATLTGSIGVIAGRFDASELSANLGVNWEHISEFDNSQLFSPFSPLSTGERAVFNRHIDVLYNGFLARVSDSRGLSLEEAQNIAQGRVWTGRQALEIGLVDALGGLNEAVDIAKIALELEPEIAIGLVAYPQPQGFMEELKMAFSSVEMHSQNYARLSHAIELMDYVGILEDMPMTTRQGGQARMNSETFIRP